MDTQTIPTIEAPEKRTAAMPVTFMARRRDLVLVMVPGRDAIDAQHRTYVVPGSKVEFVQGRFTTDDLDVIEWLRVHPRFDDISDGFFEIEPEVPEPEGELLDLAGAGAALDDAKVLAILERERAGWDRDIVVRAAEATLEAIAEQRAKLDAGGGDDAVGAAEERAAAAEARVAELEAQAASREPDAQG